MSFLLYDMEEIRSQVRAAFGDTDNYLVVVKHNDWQSDLVKLLISSLFYATDSSRQFLIYFNQKGIYEKELGTPLKGDFVLMPWHEIEEYSLKPWYMHKVIRFLHLGKKVGYDVQLSGRINQDNRANLAKLIANDWKRNSYICE